MYHVLDQDKLVQVVGEGFVGSSVAQVRYVVEQGQVESVDFGAGGA